MLSQVALPDTLGCTFEAALRRAEPYCLARAYRSPCEAREADAATCCLQAYSTSPQQISTHPRSASQDSTSRLPASASLQTSHNPLYEDDTSRVPDWAATDAQDHPTDSPVISTRSHSNAPSISQTTSPSNTTFSRSPTPRSAQPSDLTSLHSNPLAHEDPHARDTDHPARYPPSPQDLDQRPQSARSDLTHHNTRPRSAERFSQNLPRGSGERDSFSGSSLSSFASGTSDREHYSALQTTPLQQAVGAEQVQDGFGQVRRRVETQESVKDPSHHASNPQVCARESPSMCRLNSARS